MPTYRCVSATKDYDCTTTMTINAEGEVVNFVFEKLANVQKIIIVE